MAKIYDAVAICGEYQSGNQTKKRYVNCGAVFRNDDGKMWMTLDSHPTHPDWDGKLQFFEPRARGDAPTRGVAPSPTPGHQTRPSAQPEQQELSDEFQDDIPF